MALIPIMATRLATGTLGGSMTARNLAKASRYLTKEELRSMPMATHHLILVRHAEEQNSKKEGSGLTVIGECFSPKNNATSRDIPWTIAGINLGISLADEWRHYIVKPPFNGWVHTKNQWMSSYQESSLNITLQCPWSTNCYWKFTNIESIEEIRLFQYICTLGQQWIRNRAVVG